MRDRSHSHTPVQQELETHSPSNSDPFHLETINGLSDLSRTDPTFLETTIARYEQDAGVGPSMQLSDSGLQTQS
jgi:hypothetical protein